jgi:hypothetical protein
MREKARIKRILTLIEKQWIKREDQRFYQLLINLGMIEDNNELWNTEDDELEEHLKKIK